MRPVVWEAAHVLPCVTEDPVDPIRTSDSIFTATSAVPSGPVSGPHRRSGRTAHPPGPVPLPSLYASR